jgi:hypothetical protein
MYVVDHLLIHGIDETKLLSFLVLSSFFFWIVTYLAVIYIGIRHRAVGIPLVAICLNITWELLFGVVVPASPALHTLALGAVGTWGVRFELALDAVVVFILLRYGRPELPYRDLQRYFYVVIGAGVLLAYFGQHTFTAYYQDEHGLESAYIVNLVMSVQFVLMYFQREDRAGISHFVAWTKMLGTGVVSFAHLALMRPWNPDSPVASPESVFTYPQFMLYLFVSTFVIDCFYIWLTYPGGRANAQPRAAARARGTP